MLTKKTVSCHDDEYKYEQLIRKKVHISMAMTRTRQLAIFINGTLSVSKPQDPSLSYLNQLAAWLMYYKNNTINQLAEHCLCTHKLCLDGPGSELASQPWTLNTLFNTIGGSIYGHVGENGIQAALTKLENFLKAQYCAAQAAQQSLEIHAFAWSRGGIVGSLLKQAVKKLNLDIANIELTLIDPVAGGPLDRLKLPYLFGDEPETNINIRAYYSHSGNMNVWDAAVTRLPKFMRANNIFFSAFQDPTCNKRISGYKTYEHHQEIFMVPANHQGINGIARNEIEALAGQAVLAHILTHTSLDFDETWQSAAIKEGSQAQNTLRGLNVQLQQDRKMLSNHSWMHSLWGSTMQNMRSLVDVEMPTTKITSQNDVHHHPNPNL